jgi:Tol biopolymer transport system component
MPLSPGSRLGPYEILAPIGAGGMGEVYRARDTRLGREVAIKVLPQHLSGDPARRERFEREARAVSALNHPHICTLHDIGSQETADGAVDYLVMEHIEGETLANRLLKGPLPIDQVLRYAGEIADALDRAHRHGVIHRDLKPQNIMLTKSGAKLLDFGLAKLSEARGAGPESPLLPGAGGGSLLPTATRNLTTAGTLLGTFQYMAPEQLEGKEADARTDIFTFGVVVYEMATGRRAFEGKSQASLIAAILKEQPRPISELQPLYPAGLDRVVRACLEKDPDDRVQTAHDLRRQLGWVADGSLTGAGSASTSVVSSPAAGVAAAGVAPRRRSGKMWLAVPAALLFGAAMAGLGWWLRPRPSNPVLRVNLVLPPGTQIDIENRCLALSPDGSVLAYAATGADSKRQMWVRRLDSLQAQALAGTFDATYPFWSPDGAFLGFFADGKLKKVPAGGGTVQTLCDAPDGRGASWGAAGTIVFAPGAYSGLSMVSSAGGAVTPLTTPSVEGTTHRLPHFLPDGKRLLFFNGAPGKDAKNGIYFIDTAAKEPALVAAENSEGRYVPPGYLVFVREWNLLAQRMDPQSLRLSGEAVPIAEMVQFNPVRWNGAFAFSDTGLLVYRGGGGIPKARLTWFGQDGKELGVVGEPANFLELALSPDLRRTVATLWSGTGVPELWLYDLARGVGSRFTFSPEGASGPVWSPDGRQIAYANSENRIFVKAADGANEPRAILDVAGANRQITQWTPDGAGLLFWSQDPKTGLDIYHLPVAAGATPRALLSTSAAERDALVSPDGRWLLYNSNESGRREQYVVSYPSMGGKWQISTGGALTGLWVEGGRRVLYIDLDGRILSVDVTAQAGNLTIGAPRTVFGDRLANIAGSITPDGSRALVAVPIEEAQQSNLVLVTDWAPSLPRP